MYYDIFSVTNFTFCYVGPSGKYNVLKFFKNPEEWDLGRGTWDLGLGTWDHCLSLWMCLNEKLKTWISRGRVDELCRNYNSCKTHTATFANMGLALAYFGAWCALGEYRCYHNSVTEGSWTAWPWRWRHYGRSKRWYFQSKRLSNQKIFSSSDCLLILKSMFIQPEEGPHFMFTVDPRLARLGTWYMGNSATRLLYSSIVDFWMMLVVRVGVFDFLGYCAWFYSGLCVFFQL